MSRRRSSGGGGGEGGTWLNTYADMVTLLLTFFAVLLSMSSVNQDKFVAFIASFAAANGTSASSVYAYLGDDAYGDTVGGTPVTDEVAMEDLYAKLQSFVQSSGASNSVQVFGGKDVVYIRFDSVAFFVPDTYTLKPGGEEMLSYVGDALKACEGNIAHVNICGHTADPPNATVKGTWMLSGERAAVVAAYFESEKQLPGDKMVIMGYGRNYPIDTTGTSEGMERNRRVEIVVISNSSDMNVDSYTQYSGLYNSSQYPAEGDVNDVLGALAGNENVQVTANSLPNTDAATAGITSAPATDAAAGTAADGTAEGTEQQAASP